MGRDLGVMRLDVCVCVWAGGREEFGKGVILDVVLSPVAEGWASIFAVASTNFLFCFVVST